MRGHDIGQLLRRKVARHAHEQLIEGEVATWVNDGACAVVHDQKLIGLNRLPVLFNQVGKHQAGVVFVAVKLDRHGSLSKTINSRYCRSLPTFLY